jgi:hypothetical protein
MSSAFHRLFDVQPASKITNPEPTYQKSKGKAPQALHDVDVLPDVELTDFASRKTDNGRQGLVSEFDMPKGTQTPITPNELEMSRPATPNREEAVGRERLWNAEPMTKWRILCCCLIYFSNGINDSGKTDHDFGLIHHVHGTMLWINTDQRPVVGALIPYMESYYHISYSIMSLVFVGNAIGFISAAFFTNMILGKFGRAKTLIFAELIQLSAYIILVCTPPYPLVVVS